MMLRRYSGLALVAIVSAAVTYLCLYGISAQIARAGNLGQVAAAVRASAAGWD